MQDNKYINSLKYVSIIAALSFGGNVFTPSKAKAQQISDTSCSQTLPQCPTGRTLDLSQSQSAPIAANITINGAIVAIDVPGSDPNDPPAYVTATAVTSSASGIANTISAKSADTLALNYATSQNSTGSVTVNNNVTTLGAVSGIVNLISTAHGNSTQAEICCSAMDIQSTQSQSGGIISANANAITAPDLGSLLINVQSSGNNFASSGDAAGGLVQQVINQNNASQIDAISSASMCCNNVGSTQNALSVGNSSASSTYSASAYQWVVQDNAGAVNSSATTLTNDGRNLSTTAQSVGNSNMQYNNSGYTQGIISQNTNGAISSYAQSTSAWLNDSATVGSTAQGNSAVLSTIGSQGTFIADQNTGPTGNITATTDFYALTNGGVGGIVASASGNGLVGFACSSCGHPGIQIDGFTNQSNDANISANINMNNYGTGSQNSYGIAAGNSATFIAQSGTSAN